MNTNAIGAVWVVTSGELGQGGSVIAVFAKLIDAQDYVAKEMPEFTKDIRWSDWSGDYISYHSGSDWVKIAFHSVR